MRKFKDANGRWWEITLDFLITARLKDELGIDLLDFSGDTYTRMACDPGVYGHVFYVLLEDQIGDMSMREFAKGFRGETWETAFNALLDELVVFLPPRKAKILKTLVQKFRQADILATNMALETVQTLDFNRSVQETLGS